MVNIYDMVIVEFVDLEKIFGQTNKQTNKPTREPLSKGDSRTGLIAFHILLPLATLASLTHFIFSYPKLPLPH